MKISQLRRSSLALLGLLVLASPALASYDGLADSIHFYSRGVWEGVKVDFGRAPMEVRMIQWTNEATRDGSVNTTGWEYERSEDWDEIQSKIRLQARNLETAGKFKAALAKYRELDPTYAIPAFVKDREEVFHSARYRNSRLLQTYLRARYILEFREPEESIALLKSINNPPEFLRPHIAYALASTRYGSRTSRSENFLAVYWPYPKSSRAESALIMAARTLLEEGSSKSSADEIAKASRILDRLLAEFPNTRFKHNAIGWQGRCAFLTGRMDLAASLYTRQTHSKDPLEVWRGYASLAEINSVSKRKDLLVTALLRQWALPSQPSLRIRTALSLRTAFKSLTLEEAKTVQKTIRQSPSLLESYIGFRIEHTFLTPNRERNLMAFATAALDGMKRPPASLVSRVSQINYNAGRYEAACQLARKAIRLKVDRESKARARYILAASLARLGRHNEAIQEGEKLIVRSTPGYLRHGAAEFLALQHERYGDPLRALDLYIGLGYEYDAAFLADARLSPEQLKAYLARGSRYHPRQLRSHPTYSSYLSGYLQNQAGEPDRQALQYTLAMRYLRTERYAEARQAFLRLDRKVRINWGMRPEQRKELIHEDGSLRYDTPPKVRDPLEIVDKLEGLTKASQKAKSLDAKANAIYEKAAYIYRERNLLFYSPALWQGNRAFMIDMWWNDAINNQKDQEALDRHLHEHECLAQSLRLCEEVVSKYPTSKVMPKALYTAALSAERLSNLNTTWRLRGERLKKIAINRLDRLQREFPGHALAKPALKYKYEFVAQLKNPYQ